VPLADFAEYVPEQMSLNGFETLGIGFRTVARCASLSFHHRDPFHRLLIAQAQKDDLAIVSRDFHIDAYGLKRIW
jgi:PIN domain nuclease of toxin-antitoxin system